MYININTLKAALLFAHKDEHTTNALRSVLFIPQRDNTTVIVSTDGFRMGFIREESGETTITEPLTITRTVLDTVVKAAGKSKRVEITSLDSTNGTISIVDGISVPFVDQHHESASFYRYWMDYIDRLSEKERTTTDRVAFSPVFMNDFGKALKLLGYDDRTARFRFYGDGDDVKYIMAQAGTLYTGTNITAIIMPIREKERIEKQDWLLRISPRYVDPNAKKKDVPPKGKGKNTPAAA